MNEIELKSRLYVPNFEFWKQQCSKKYYSERALVARQLENGIVVPPLDKDNQFGSGGIFDRNLHFFAGYDNLYADKRDANSTVELDPKSIEKSDEEVIFGGGLTCHFGHFITESLNRMWFPLEYRTTGKKFVFLNLFNWKISRWVYKLFDLLGIPEDRIMFVDKPTQFKSLVVPDQSAYIKENFTSKFLLPYRRIASRIRPAGVKKLFLTRGLDLHTKNYVANLKYFEDFYRARGYEVLAPEKLSIADQISLIAGADEIATFLGTLAHWSLFCREGVKFTMLTRYDQFRCRQCLINEATGIDWYIVSTARNFLYAEQGAGVNLVGATEHWQNFVRDHFDEEIEIEDRLPQDVVDDYIGHWCRYFSQAEHLQKRIDSLTNVYNRGSLMECQVRSARPLLCCETHIAKKGWLPSSLEGEVNGVVDQKLSLQALRVYFLKPYCDVKCAVYYPNEGWTESVGAKKIAGTVGKGKPVFGVKIALERNDEFDIVYRAHDFGGEWSDWCSNGAELISDSAINAIQIRLAAR